MAALEEDEVKQYYGETEQSVTERASPSTSIKSPKVRQSPAKTELARLKSKLKKSEEENATLKQIAENSKGDVEKIRTKLHNAIRKGKAIEADRSEKAVEIEQLKKRLQENEGHKVQSSSVEAEHVQIKLSTLEAQLEQECAAKDVWKKKAEESSTLVATLEKEKKELLNNGDLHKPANEKKDSAGGGEDVEEEVKQLRKEKKALEQKVLFETAAREGAVKEAEQELEKKENDIKSLKHEMSVLQTAVRSAAERVADATAAESRASEDYETKTSQVNLLQRRVAELEGQLDAAGDQEKDKNRLSNEILNLKTERDEIENEKLLLENDNKFKQDQLVQLEENLQSVQEECVRLTKVAEESRNTAKVQLGEKEEEFSEIQRSAEEAVQAAKTKEALAAEREMTAVRNMEEMMESLKTFRHDEEERKKKFSRLQGKYSAELQDARNEIESLKVKIEEYEESLQTQSKQQVNDEGESKAPSSNNLDESQLKAALLAATEPLSKKIEEYRLKAEQAEEELKNARQKNMELSGNLAKMEISASQQLKVEESVSGYQDAVNEAKAREISLQQELDHLMHEQEKLKEENSRLMEGDFEASSSEIQLLKEQLEESQRSKIQMEDQAQKVVALQKENKDLRWQIAMTSTDGSVQINIPKQLEKKAAAPAGIMAKALKRWKFVLLAYLMLLHFLVYYALTHHSTRAVHGNPISLHES